MSFHYDPNEGMLRPNRGLIYFGASMIGIRLTLEKQVHCQVMPTIAAIEDLIDLAHGRFTQIFRKVRKVWNG